MTTRIAPQRLWFSLVAAPAAWVVQGLLGWLFGARICTGMSIGSVRTVLSIIGLVALAIAFGGLFVGVGNWRAATSDVRPAADRVEFMSFGGVLVSAIFAIGIFWAVLNALLIDVCGGMR